MGLGGKMYAGVTHRLGFLVAVLCWLFTAMAADAVMLPEQNAAPETLVVRYPVPDSNDVFQNRVEYFTKQLFNALDKSGRPYQLVPSSVPHSSAGRSAQYIMSGRYDISWMHTSEEYESMLRPVRVPLLKGLIGWRIFIIRKESQKKFSAIETLDELKALLVGQGHNWPDNKILAANDFKLRTAPNRQYMVKMLAKGRVDFFPRSITEIWDEMKEYDKDELMVEKHLVLQYPSAFFFFMAKDNVQLAETLESGLLKAHQDGSFDAIFMEYFGDIIRRARLRERKVFSIHHPTLQLTLPLANKNFWFSTTPVPEAVSASVTE